MHNEQIETAVEPVSSKSMHYCYHLQYRNDSDAYKWSLQRLLANMSLQLQS
jgi:hypothetical protein